MKRVILLIMFSGVLFGATGLEDIYNRPAQSEKFKDMNIKEYSAVCERMSSREWFGTSREVIQDSEKARRHRLEAAEVRQDCENARRYRQDVEKGLVIRIGNNIVDEVKREKIEEEQREKNVTFRMSKAIEKPLFQKINDFILNLLTFLVMTALFLSLFYQITNKKI